VGIFWIESDHPGGEHSYDAVVANLAIARLHIVEPTGVTVGVTIRDEGAAVRNCYRVRWMASSSFSVGSRMVRREDAESFPCVWLRHISFGMVSSR
jgi:hypothetical protein